MNPWAQFENKSFEIADLGRPAIFYVPVKKLKGEKGIHIRLDLHLFLMSQFGAYSASTIKSFVTHGFWKGSSRAVISDESIIYEVSFVGKDKIPILLKRLAKLALETEEECIYIKAGQYSGLIYHKKVQGATS